jgi:hypothetical protein
MARVTRGAGNVTLSLDQIEMIGRGISHLLPLDRDGAQHDVESRLRGVLQVTDSDVQRAIDAALAKVSK